MDRQRLRYDETYRVHDTRALMLTLLLIQCAMVLYSSGTTSAPKAVELSHLTLNVHAETVRFCRYASPTQRLLTCLPFFHVAGSVVCRFYVKPAADYPKWIDR